MDRTRVSKPDFRLNLLQVTLSADQFSAGFLPFETSDQLHRLRTDHPTTHVIQRYQNKVACIPLTAAAPSLGEPSTVKVANAPWLVCKLLRETLLRLFAHQGYTFTNFDPLSFVRRSADRDLLTKAIGEAQAVKVKHAHVYREDTFALRVLFSIMESPMFGIQIDTGIRCELDCTIAQLIQLGLDPTGLYVRARRQDGQFINPHRDPSSLLRLVGCVRQVLNNQLLLEDAPEVTELSADQAWLEATSENIETYLRLAGISDITSVLARLQSSIFNTVGAQGRLAQFERQAAWLQKKGSFPLALGLSCTVGEPVAPNKGTDVATYRQFSPPEFVFNPARSKTHNRSHRGLEAFGPFDNESFPTKRPNIAVVTPDAYQGDVEVFLGKFRDGVPRANVFTRGFVRVSRHLFFARI